MKGDTNDSKRMTEEQKGVLFAKEGLVGSRYRNSLICGRLCGVQRSGRRSDGRFSIQVGVALKPIGLGIAER